MGPFMVEIVFCRVTRRGRKKGKGMNKLAKENCRNDGPAFQFIPPEDTVKVTLDLSENGPVFSAMDDLMMKMLDEDNEGRKKGGKKGGDEAKKSLKRLLKSGIPGVEKMFAAPTAGPGGPGGKKQSKGFHKMTDQSKQKFMNAVFGEDGTAIDTGTAAALLAATCSGGDPEIGENIAQLLVPEMGDKVDPAMMAALMSSCSMINAGASTEEVMKAMKAELRDSGMSEEEILHKTQTLMKAFRREETSNLAEYSLASKQKNSALKKNNTSPKDFAQVVLVQKAIAACGSTPENVAKVIMIENQLSKRGAQSRHIADALRNLGDFEAKREEVSANIAKAFLDDKLKKDDVFLNVRMTQAIDNENEPTWKEVKNMKDILAGCSPTSPEAIELNLARATKTAGLTKNDIAAVLIAQKAMAALHTDAKTMAQVVNMQKTIAQNGVPAIEIARVLSDGTVPKEALDELCSMALNAFSQDLNGNDVDAIVDLYDNLRLKSNIPLEVIDHIDNTLIQVRCSLEDVADNLVSSQLARGEKENMVVRGLCETLAKTGASTEIVATTMMTALRKVLRKPECDIMKDIGRTLNEQGADRENVTKAMSELLLNLLDENPDWREDLIKAMEMVLKEAGGFPNEIREYMSTMLPPEPPKAMDPRLAAELERLKAEDDAREAEKARKALEGSSDSDIDFVDEGGKNEKIPKKKKNPKIDIIVTDSRRGSLTSRRGSNASSRSRCDSITLGGVERRGSYYGEDVSKRSTVAVVVDDPDNKKNMANALHGVFNDEANGHSGPTVVTVIDPKTGKPTPKVVQTVVDPKTGKVTQTMTDASPEDIANATGMASLNNIKGGGNMQLMDGSIPQGNPTVVTVTDPSGKLIQQIVQTVIDPKTGKTSQVITNTNQTGSVPQNISGASNMTVVTVTDPTTGKPTQQVVQTVVDPKTGQVSQVMTPAANFPPGALNGSTLSNMSGASNMTVVTVTDPKTGKPTQQVVQTIVDPKTGQVSQVAIPASNLPPGALNAAAGGGAFMPSGITVNPDGSISQSTLSGVTAAPPSPMDVLQSILSDALQEGNMGPDLEATLQSIRQGRMTEDDVSRLMAVFDTSGVVHNIGGVAKFRTVRDLRDTVESTQHAFDDAMEDARNKPVPGLSEENRKLMEDILKKSLNDQQDIGNRVAALLAGSALTTTSGVTINKREPITEVPYMAVGEDLSKLREPRRRRYQSEDRGPVSLHQATSADLDSRAAAAGIKITRRSIKRQSLSRLRRTSERDPSSAAGSHNGLKEENEDDTRRITGLRRSKVPLMVYSCGGFTRCFRIARIYQGPPIGVTYSEENTSRSALNPELNT